MALLLFFIVFFAAFAQVLAQFGCICARSPCNCDASFSPVSYSSSKTPSLSQTKTQAYITETELDRLSSADRDFAAKCYGVYGTSGLTAKDVEPRPLAGMYAMQQNVVCPADANPANPFYKNYKLEPATCKQEPKPPNYANLLSTLLTALETRAASNLSPSGTLRCLPRGQF